MNVTGKAKRFHKLFKEWFFKESIFYRIYWTTAIGISIWALMWISKLTLNRYFSDSISIGFETTYLQWNNTFPSVTFCLLKNRSTTIIQEYVKGQNIPYKVSESNFVRTLQDYIFSNPNNVYFKTSSCDGLNSTCGVDILQTRKKLFATSCEEFMFNVSYLNIPHKNCSDIFKFHELEMGYCFVANNLIDAASYEELPLKFGAHDTDYSLKLYLKVGFIWKYEMYVNSPENLPHFDSVTYDVLSDPTVYLFNVEEYHNDIAVRHEPITSRLCKFPEEKDEGSPWHYSTSTCMSYLRIQYELKECNCTHFTSPRKYKSKYCDVEGLKCISDAQTSVKTKNYAIQNRACYPSCVEQLITTVGSIHLNTLETDGMAFVNIKIANLPTVRYSRVVTATYLDLVVSVGGIIGLFVGISAINILELFYWCLCRRN